MKLAFITKNRYQGNQDQLEALDQLQKIYQVTIFDFDQVLLGNIEEFYPRLNQDFNIIIFWKLIPSKEQLRIISCKKNTIFLGEESAGNQEFSYWRRYRIVKFLSFCPKVHQLLNQYGLDSNFIPTDSLTNDATQKQIAQIVQKPSSQINYRKFLYPKIAELLLKAKEKLYLYYKKFFIQIPILNQLICFPYRFSKTKEFLQDNPNAGQYLTIYPAVEVKLSEPKKLPEEERSFYHQVNGIIPPYAIKEAFLAKIPEGNYVSKFHSYITKDGTLLDDISVEFSVPADLRGFDRKIFWSQLPSETYYDGTVAIVDHAGNYNYNHWMIHVLPKLDFFEKSDIKIDRYVINIDKSFQKESLAFINFPMKKIIPIHDALNIKARTLLVAPTVSTSALHPKSIEFLRKKFSTPKTLEKKIFITRRNAAQGRRIIDEDKVLTMLENYQFEVVELEKFSFKQQVELFSKASLVLSPHGAGLTNIIFCSPQAKVIELYNPNYLQGAYARLASLLGLDYYYLVGENFDEKKGQHDCSGNITIDLQKLEKILQLSGAI